MQTVESWSVEEVVSFITSLGGSAAKYANAFRDNQVTGGLLLELEDADLEELGVSNALHKKKILKAVRKAASGPGEPPSQPGEPPAPPGAPAKRQPGMARQPSEGAPDTPEAILKSALTGCLLSLSSSDEESVMNMMAMILGNKELSHNDKQFVRGELKKRSAEKSEEILKQDPSLPGSSPPIKPSAAPDNAGETDLAGENAHLKEVIEVKDKTIAKLKKKIETLIRTQLEDITDVAEDNLAGRSALKRSATQMNALQDQLHMKHQSMEETLRSLKDTQIQLTQKEVEIAKAKMEIEQKEEALVAVMTAKTASEQEAGELRNMMAMMEEEMEAESKENETKIEQMKTELESKSQILTTMVMQNAQLQQQVQQDAGKSEELEKAKKDLADLRTNLAKQTAEVDQMKTIVSVKNSDLTEFKTKLQASEKQLASLTEEMQVMEAELMTHKELSAEAGVKGKELEEVRAAKEQLETSFADTVAKVTQLNQAIALKDIKIAELSQEVTEKDEELTKKNGEVQAQVMAMVTLTQQKMKLEQELAETSSKLEQVEAGFDANKSQLEAQMVALSDTIEAMAVEHESAMEEKVNIHTAQLFAKQKELDSTKESLREKIDSEKLLSATVASLSAESSNKSDKIASLQLELQQCGSVEEALSSENDELTTQITSLSGTVASLISEIQQKNDALASVQVELQQRGSVEEALTSENDELSTQIAALSATVASLSSEMQQKNLKLAGLQTELTQKGAVEEALAGENDSLSDQIRDLTTQLGAKVTAEAQLRNDLNTERALRQSESDQLRRENASLKQQVNEMQSTLQAISESASQQEQEMGNQIKLLSSSLNQTQQDLLAAQTLSTQHKIQTGQLRKELDEAKSVSQITIMQKDEVIREKTKSYTQLQGEYESLKTIIKEMNEGSIRSRERHQQEVAANQIQLNEKEQQISKLQKSIREFAEKAKSEQQSLREQLQVSISETNDARRQVQESTERYQRSSQELRARQMEVEQLKQVIQAQSSTIQEQNKRLVR